MVILQRMKELRDYLHGFNPEVILNDRMHGYGDYHTPECGMPLVAPEGPWEFCIPVNDSWGYQPQDKNYKSVRQLVRIFAECIGMGGNLLLNIGPLPDGSIDPEQEIRLLGLGDWIAKHAMAVYPAGAGLPPGYFYGSSTLSKDRTSLYLICFDRPWEGDGIAVKGIKNKVISANIMASGRQLPYKTVGGGFDVPGTLWIDIPESELDPCATVVELKLDGPLDLYRGSGHAITQN